MEDRSGKPRTNKEEIAETWREYCQDLYKDENHNRARNNEEAEEPEILKCEVESAIRKLKLNKAPGDGGIT